MRWIPLALVLLAVWFRPSGAPSADHAEHLQSQSAGDSTLLWYLNWEGIEIRDVAQGVARVTGKNITFADTVDTRLTIHSIDRVSVSQTWEIFTYALKNRGIAVEHLATSEHLVTSKVSVAAGLTPPLATIAARFEGSDREFATRLISPLLSPRGHVALLDADMMVVTDEAVTAATIMRVLAALQPPVPEPRHTSMPAQTPPPKPAGNPYPVVRERPNYYTMKMSDFQKVCNNLNDVATQARIVPNFKNGTTTNGFKLFSIRPESIFEALGFQNGDVITRINGINMTSPERALEVYERIRKTARIDIDVDLERNGSVVSNVYALL